jgi:hypothetical protein
MGRTFQNALPARWTGPATADTPVWFLRTDDRTCLNKTNVGQLGQKPTSALLIAGFCLISSAT